ncbi:MIP family channel protein [Cellulomonas sp.]|uniref:MIP family channel protein n=1 Tax=Cellulomonas sp. TaxID=40001 RepID=UPI002584C0CC|nr:MIP family channel protein [Cellulomonas sp.]MCR6690692.1 MIP family channel protein [Cellulomonas sp.]
MSQDTTPAAPAPEPAANEPVGLGKPSPATAPVPTPDGLGTGPDDAPGTDPSDDEGTDYAAYVVPAGTVVVQGPSLLARVGAEVFGTFMLVLVGLGVAIYASLGSVGGGALGVALAFGVAVLAAAAAVGHVSGGHFNPAVTLGAALAGRTAWRDVLPYWLAQLMGGALGAAIVFIAIPSSLPQVLGQDDVRALFSGVANGYGEHSPLNVIVVRSGQGFTSEFTLFAALVLELVATAVFVGVILGATDRRAHRALAPVAIGLALAVLLLVTIPATNGSLNPARSFAAALFSESWAWKQLWVFVVAPFVGAALAGLVYRAFAAEPPVEDNLLEDDDVYVTQEDVVVVESRQA